MTARLLPALLLPLAALPLAAADHAATCGAADGTVADGVSAWLRPGCLGVRASVPGCRADVPLVHGQVLAAQVVASPCGAGAWLP
ncbi:MAG TPA: hypothetical protein VNX21_06675 [Candidatus Thermoplasmatota archaeon]|nr:hypothetical protein [Candidatus Thermoplasmatota archaeon]